MRTVAVFHIGSLGDAIISIPALRAVRASFPRAYVLLVTNAHARQRTVAAEAVLEGTRLVDEVLTYDADARGARRALVAARLLKQIRARTPEVAVYLMPSERAASSVERDRRFFHACGVREFYGFHAFDRATLYPRGADGQPLSTPHEAVRKIDRLRRDGLEIADSVLDPPFLAFTGDERAEVDRWLADHRHGAGPLVLVAPFANMTAKLWPRANVVELGRRLLARHGTDVVVAGGAADVADSDALIREWGGGLNSAGVFSTRVSAALAVRADLHIGLDSGSGHLAAAAGTRCLTIASDRDNPGQWEPLGRGHLVVRHRVPCGGCQAQTCEVAGHPCMTSISVDDVLGAIDAAGAIGR